MAQAGGNNGAHHFGVVGPEDARVQLYRAAVIDGATHHSFVGPHDARVHHYRAKVVVDGATGLRGAPCD